MRIRLVTLNAWGLPFPLAPYPRTSRFPRIGRYLREGAFDVVALQEVWSGSPRLQVDGLLPPDDQGDSGLRIGSGLPVLRIRAEAFEAGCGPDRFKHKGFLSASLRLPDGGTLEVVSTHLQAGRRRRAAEVRAAQAAQLVDWLKQVQGPAVVMGDFNLHRHLPLDRRVDETLAEAGLEDLATVDHPTFVWSSDRFDRVYARHGQSARVVAEAVQVVRYGRWPRFVPFLSDHRPVEAEIRLAAAGARAA